MDTTIIIRDDTGEIEIHYEDILKYHGRDFYGGVALTFKALQMAFARLCGAEPPLRNAIRVVVGFDPPGVIDTIEFVTRAVTRRRLILEPEPPKGPPSVFGRYYFEIHCADRGLRMWLKPGILPEGFTLLARKAFAGIANETELERWKNGKQTIGGDLISRPPEEILEYEDLHRGY
jgi:hypothetical protein